MDTNTIIIEEQPLGDELLSTPFLVSEDKKIVAGAVDYKLRPAVRSETGRWRSAAFIIGVEMAERVCYNGISGNLINFLTGKLGQSTAAAAANVNVWSGVSLILPILGAVLADSYMGKYYTVISASVLYIMGLSLLTLSAMLPSLNCPTIERSIQSATECSSSLQTILFFAALYLVAIGQGGHKPCVQAFGADQFDGQDPAECKAKSSFFNWWYFGLSLGALLGIGILSYVQENLSWGLGFGIPCIIMVLALLIYVLGTSTYRYIKISEKEGPFSRIGRVFVLAARNRKSMHLMLENGGETGTIKCHHGSEQFRFLDKALLASDNPKGGVVNSIDVEEAKFLVGLFPIWATSLVFGIVFSQITTFFTKQGVTLDRSIGPSFNIPAASLQSLIGICIISVIPIYDRLLVPIARNLSGKPAGISMLQRIGTGLFISIISMVVAAVIEMKRLKTALQYRLIDSPGATIPMSIWWLLPQYVLFGIADAFTIVGLQEFFYDQVPVELRSLGMALYLSILGIGGFLSSILVSFLDRVTSSSGMGTSWFSDNLNRAHLDYFYWLLAGFSIIGLILFLHFSRSYTYRR